MNRAMKGTLEVFGMSLWTIFVIFAVVWMFGCASTTTPATIVHEAVPLMTTKLNFRCQEYNKAHRQQQAICIATNFASFVPKWTAITEGEPTTMGEGETFVFMVYRGKWTLIEMSVSDGFTDFYLRAKSRVWTDGSVQFQRWVK